MQRMWEKIHPETLFKETRAHSHGQKALQVRRVRKIVLPSKCSQGSSAGPRGSEETRVWRMRKEIYDKYSFKPTPPYSHWRGAFRLSPLPQEIQTEMELEETHPE